MLLTKLCFSLTQPGSFALVGGPKVRELVRSGGPPATSLRMKTAVATLVVLERPA